MIKHMYEGIFGSKQPEQAAKIPGKPLSKNVLGSLVGTLTGIIGLGGGYALVPSYIYFLKSPVKLAIGTSMAAFVRMALVGPYLNLPSGWWTFPLQSPWGWAPWSERYMGKTGFKVQTECPEGLVRFPLSLRIAQIYTGLFRNHDLKREAGNYHERLPHIRPLALSSLYLPLSRGSGSSDWAIDLAQPAGRSDAPYLPPDAFREGQQQQPFAPEQKRPDRKHAAAA